MKKLLIIAYALLFNLTLPAYGADKKESKVTNAADEVAKIAPEFMKLTKETLFGDIWERPGLTKREKSLVTITVLATLARTEQIDYHLGFGLDNGLKQEEIVAALTHVAFYAGWPSAMTGLQHFKKVLDERTAKK